MVLWFQRYKNMICSFQIDEFYYAIRIFPGQDPANVWVGWVTPKFHYYSASFNLGESVRRCRFQYAANDDPADDRYV